MGMTIDTLKALLQKPNTTFYSDGNDTLLYPFPHQGQMMNVYVQLLEDGEYVRFFIPYYLTLADIGDRERIYLKLLDLNRQYKFLKFGVDPADMEVTVSIEVPVEDGNMTEDQLTRCMAAVTSVAMDERGHLKTLISTGIYPSSDDPQFQDALSTLLGEEDPEKTESMDALIDCSQISAEAILEMDDEALTKLIDEIESDEQWEP